MQGHIKWLGAKLDAHLLSLIYLCGEDLLSETSEGSGWSRSAQAKAPPGFLKTWRKLQCLPLGHLPLSKSPEREREGGGGEEGVREEGR